MRPAENRPGEKGFTLLEVMMAMIILAVSMLGLAHLIVVALGQHTMAQQTTMAAGVARGKIEELQALYNWELETGNTSSQLSTGSHGPETIMLDTSGGSDAGAHSFSVSWEVGNPNGKQKSVAVTVIPSYEIPLFARSVVISSQFAP